MTQWGRVGNFILILLGWEKTKVQTFTSGQVTMKFVNAVTRNMYLAISSGERVKKGGFAGQKTSILCWLIQEFVILHSAGKKSTGWAFCCASISSSTMGNARAEEAGKELKFLNKMNNLWHGQLIQSSRVREKMESDYNTYISLPPQLKIDSQSPWINQWEFLL